MDQHPSLLGLFSIANIARNGLGVRGDDWTADFLCNAVLLKDTTAMLICQLFYFHYRLRTQ